MSLSAKPVIVIAGQTPPPLGGQNVMVDHLLNELRGESGWCVEHLEFRFTPSFSSVRRANFSKVCELLKVYLRLFRIILRHGRVDLVIYPSGGPQTVPVLRDILLLPIVRPATRRLLIQFHAAGIAERLKQKHGFLERLLKNAYTSVDGAIVMTDFNRSDPEALGISKVEVIPHQLKDENPEGRLPDYSVQPLRILYAGHLYGQKGTPQLIEAFARVARDRPGLRCLLMGEFLPPYSWPICEARCREMGIADLVEWVGVRHGAEKNRIFADAGLFVFPSVAPYESFGLVMVEAMMWGLPIVATDWRGNRDVAGSVAEYCETGERMVESMAAALEKILASRDMLQERAWASRSRFERFFCKRPGCKPYIDLVKRVLSSGGNGKS